MEAKRFEGVEIGRRVADLPLPRIRSIHSGGPTSEGSPLPFAAAFEPLPRVQHRTLNAATADRRLWRTYEKTRCHQHVTIGMAPQEVCGLGIYRYAPVSGPAFRYASAKMASPPDSWRLNPSALCSSATCTCFSPSSSRNRPTIRSADPVSSLTSAALREASPRPSPCSRSTSPANKVASA